MGTKKKSSRQTRNAAAVAGETSSAPISTKVALPPGFTAKRAVTLPAIVLKKEGESRCLRIEEPMHLSAAKMDGKATKTEEGKTRAMEPATVCAAVDVVTGEMGNFVVPAVVKGNLEEKYPDNSYVGCVFQITHNGKRQGKRYADFTVIELQAE